MIERGRNLDLAALDREQARVRARQRPGEIIAVRVGGRERRADVGAGGRVLVHRASARRLVADHRRAVAAASTATRACGAAGAARGPFARPLVAPGLNLHLVAGVLFEAADGGGRAGSRVRMRRPATRRALAVPQVVIVDRRTRIGWRAPVHRQARGRGSRHARGGGPARWLLQVDHGHHHIHRIRGRTVAHSDCHAAGGSGFVIE